MNFQYLSYRRALIAPEFNCNFYFSNRLIANIYEDIKKVFIWGPRFFYSPLPHYSGDLIIRGQWKFLNNPQIGSEGQNKLVSTFYFKI